MAVIIGIHDADERRRTRAREALPESLSGLSHLTRRVTSFDKIDIYWEASASTPVSIATDHLHETDRIAFVVGDFDAPYAAKSDAAKRLLRRSADDSPDLRCISGQNGYYLAMLFDGGQVSLGVDVLGMFPLYYWAMDDVFMFGTSPSLFKVHPLFVAEPSTYAIASKLLISHISGGRSLYKNVRRNNPGYFVVWKSGAGIKEIEGNSLQMSDTGFDTSIYETRDRIASYFDTFHHRLSGLPKVSVLLSGGQDSRLVAGYTNKYFPHENVKAVSLGNKTDQELQCAMKTSHTLNWQHRHQEIECEKYISYAMSEIRLESLQGPFATFDIYTARGILSESADPFLSGYFGDAVLGDAQVYRAFSNKTGMLEFNQLFKNLNRYGFEGKAITELIIGENAKNVVNEVIEDLLHFWNRIDGFPFQKAWMFGMSHRLRFHVGSTIWRLSLGAWPLIPYLDRSCLDTVASIPLDYFLDRRIQVDIIKNEFPKLATLPLDRNASKPGYIIKPLRRQFLDALPPVSSISWRLHKWLLHKRVKQDDRYYYRTFDFNSPAWQSVRREVDRFRTNIGNLLNREAVDRYLPPAEATPYFNDGIIDSIKLKTMLGLIWWNNMDRL